MRAALRNVASGGLGAFAGSTLGTFECKLALRMTPRVFSISTGFNSQHSP
jgi:hypothetical protein